MDLSIIIPVYNVEKYIRTCLISVLSQGVDESRFEVIIVNDGSTDNSIEAVKDIIISHSNITLINQENQGLSVARNNGIALAKGEYILMPDSDDLLVENSLKPIIEKALETKDDMVIADFLKMDDKDIQDINNSPVKQPSLKMYEKTGKQFFLEDMLPTECYVWRTLFRRDFLIENNITFYPGIYFQDVPFTQECYLKANKCLKISRFLSIYRRGHNTAATSLSSFSLKKAMDLCIAITKTWELKRLDNISPALKKKIDSNVYSLYSNLCFRILYYLSNREEAVQTLKFLDKQAPDLRFTNGIAQRIGNLLRRKAPHIYLISLDIRWSIH